MQYIDFEVWDFIQDDFFMEWVRNPNAESNEFWSNWIKANPHRAAVLERAVQIAKSIRYTETQPLHSSEYNEMLESIVRDKRRSTNIMSLLVKIAAVIVIASGVYWWQQNNVVQKTNAEFAATRVITKSNPKGRKSLIVLPDGTRVKLNSESSLTFNDDFGSQARKVILNGEAFFDVAKDRSKPFIITSGKLETKVLGTSFNIRSYQNEETIQVVVVSGEVSVRDSIGTSLLLNPKDILKYGVYEGSISRSICRDFKSVIGWKDGFLIFDNDPFDKVAEKIESWYGVEVKFFNGCRIPGSYTGEYYNKSLEKVIDGISYASGFEYKITNDTTVLISKRQ